MNLSDTSSITYKLLKNSSDTEIAELLIKNQNWKNREYQFLEKAEINRLKKIFNAKRVCQFSKCLEIKKHNLTLIITDAGISIYDNNKANEIKFIKNFYSGNDIE